MHLVHLHVVCIILWGCCRLEAQLIEIPRELDQYLEREVRNNGMKLCGPVSQSIFKVNDSLKSQCPNLAKWLLEADKFECDIQTADPSKDPDDDGFVPSAVLRIRFFLWRNKKGESRLWVLYPPPTTAQLKDFGSNGVLGALWADFGQIRIPDASASEPIESIAPFYINAGSSAASRSRVYQLLEEDEIADGESLTPFPFEQSLIVATCHRRGLIMADKASGAVSCLSVDDPGIWQRDFGIQTSGTDNFRVQIPTKKTSSHQFIEHIAGRQITWLECD